MCVCVCACVCVSQITSIDSESTASPPHAVVNSTSSQPAVGSSDTDRTVTMDCSTADQHDVADDSAASTKNSELMAAVASVGGDTADAVSDGQSADKTESVTCAKNSEPRQEGEETVSTPAVEGIAGSETVYQAVSKTVPPSSAAEMAETTESVEKHCDMEMGEMHAGDGDSSAIDQPTSSSDPSMATSAGTGTSDPSVATTAGTGTSDPIMSTSAGTRTSSDPSMATSAGTGTLDPSVATSAGTLTSSQRNMDSVSDFLALTYLVHPPDGSTFERPYLDDFWQSRWDRMESEIRRMLKKSSRLASDVITLGSSSSSDYDSSDDDLSEYEDSMASTSPIFVEEKKSGTVDDEGEDSCDEIVLDENSSNAIVVGDDDDNIDDVDDAEDDVDEIICSGGTNEDQKNGDSSIVVCDADVSVDEITPPRSEPSAARPQDTDLTNCSSAVVGMHSESSEVTAEPDVSDQCPEARKVGNGSEDVPGLLDKTDKPEIVGDVEDSVVRNGGDVEESVVRNGGSCVADGDS